MIINHHILKLSNVYYSDKQFYITKKKNINYNHFIDNYRDISYLNKSNIDNISNIENLFVINTLHSCFSHALIDNIFAYFWAINDIKKHDSSFKSFICFIRQKHVLKFKNNNLPLINSKQSKYKDVWGNLIELINNNLIFEHVLNNKSKFLIKNCYFYIINDHWQRSPWNCNINYPSKPGKPPCRNVKKIIYHDNIIYEQLASFVNYTKNKYKVATNTLGDKYEAIIIERRSNRFWDKNILDNIINKIEENSSINYNGIKILEGLTLHQQIKLFSENNIFIFRHGSCLANLLWIPENSIIFDIDVCSYRKPIINRIAKLTNSKVISILYNNINYSLFEKI